MKCYEMHRLPRSILSLQTEFLVSVQNPSISPRPMVESLKVTPWSDPLIDRLGHDPRSVYVEQFWLGILGPSTVWLLRHCASRFDSAPEGFELALSDVAGALGLGHKGGRNSPLARSILRACRFGAARAAGEGELQVRRHVAPLNRGQIERLPEFLRERHRIYTERELDMGDLVSQRRRARRLALGLVACGGQVDDAELQLGRWRIHPSVAAEAVRWAWSQHEFESISGPEAA